MIYGKLIDGAIVYAPRKLTTVDGCTVYNPPAELLIAQGYKPVICSSAPEVEEGFVAAEGWEETEEAIVQTWHAEPEGDIPDAEALEILMGGGA